MAVAAYSELREQVRMESGDIAGIRWLDPELDRYIQAGQREYVLRRMELKGSVSITGDGSTSVFTAPPDCLQPYCFIDSDGYEVPIYSFRQLADNFTARFIADTGNKNIHICCLNFNNWNQIRFYPLLASGVGGTLHYYRLPLNGEIEIDEYALKFYVLWRMYLRESDIDYVKKAMYYRDLFAGQIYNVTTQGRMIMLPVPGALPGFGEIKADLRTLLQDGDGEIWADHLLDDYLNEAQHQFVKATRCLKKSFDMAPHVNGRFYFPDDHIESLYSWNERDMTIAPTAEHRLRRDFGAAALSASGVPENIYEGSSPAEYRLFPNPTTECEPVELTGHTLTGWYTFGAIVCGDWSADGDNLLDGFIDDWGHVGLLLSFDATKPLYEMWNNPAPFDLGVVRYIEGVEMDGEDGAVRRILDETAGEYNVAFSEYGACNALIGHDRCGSMQYVRRPYVNTMEIRNPDALIWFAAARCLEEDREHKDLNKAAALRQAFRDTIGFEAKVNSRQNGHRQKGSFF